MTRVIHHKPQQAIAFGAARFGRLRSTSVRLRTGRMLGLANVITPKDERHHVKELIPRNTVIPMERPVTQRFQPVNPTCQHTIFLQEARTDTPSIYNPEDFRDVVSLTVDFGTDTPQTPDFDVSVIIDETNSIRFTATDPAGRFATVTTTVNYSDFV